MGNNAAWTNNGTALSMADVSLQLDYAVPSSVVPPAPGVPVMTPTQAIVAWAPGAGYSEVTPQYRAGVSGTWLSLPALAAGPAVYSGLSPESTYQFRLLPDGDADNPSNAVEGVTSAAPDYTPWVLHDFGNLPSGWAAPAVYGDPVSGFPNVYTSHRAGFGSARSTSAVYPGRATSLACSLASGSDGDPFGGGPGVPYGLFGLSVELPQALVKGEYIHVQVRLRFPAAFNWNGSPALKFLRAHTSTDAGGTVNQGWNDFYINRANSDVWGDNTNPLSGNPGGSRNGQVHAVSEFSRSGNYWTSAVLEKERWEIFELRVGLDNVSISSGGIGSIMAWQYDPVGERMVLAGNFGNFPTLNAAGHYCRRVNLFTYWNGFSPANNTVYVDRVIIEKNINLLPAMDAAGNRVIGLAA